MATKTITLDDLDGSEGAETIRISVGDRIVDIDLAKASRTALDKALAPYFDKGRPVVKKSSGNGGSTQAIRDWLRSNGHEIGDKGRIPEDKQALYDAANPAA
jgi:hypothetical protein